MLFPLKYNAILQHNATLQCNTPIQLQCNTPMQYNYNATLQHNATLQYNTMSHSNAFNSNSMPQCNDTVQNLELQYNVIMLEYLELYCPASPDHHHSVVNRISVSLQYILHWTVLISQLWSRGFSHIVFFGNILVFLVPLDSLCQPLPALHNGEVLIGNWK